MTRPIVVSSALIENRINLRAQIKAKLLFLLFHNSINELHGVTKLWDYGRDDIRSEWNRGEQCEQQEDSR